MQVLKWDPMSRSGDRTWNLHSHFKNYKIQEMNRNK